MMKWFQPIPYCMKWEWRIPLKSGSVTNLPGGLYGVSQGRVFFGESMFSRVPNASKVALAHLAGQLKRWSFGSVDCQMKTAHLASLGAVEIAREEFSQRLKELVN